MKLIIIFLTITIGLTQAQASVLRDISPANSIVDFGSNSTQKKPFFHYGKVRYYAFKAVDRDTFDMIKTVLENFPDDVIALGYYRSNEPLQQIKNLYKAEVNYNGQIDFIEVDNTHPDIFWAKSALPYPVKNLKQWGLVGHNYFIGEFEPTQEFAGYFNLPYTNYDLYNRGGNLAANEDGLCITVNTIPSTTVDEIPDNIYNQFYGCKKLIRLSHDKGIGDVNEVVKFINRNTVITDQKQYIPLLKKANLNVVEILDANKQLAYASYVNASFVNGTAFVPTYNLETDKAALSIYKNLGFKAVGVDSRRTVQLKGSIDGITATYPEMK